jgi:hypothetical protein
LARAVLYAFSTGDDAETASPVTVAEGELPVQGCSAAAPSTQDSRKESPTMKRAMIFALSSLVSTFSLTGCLEGEADMMNDMASDEETGEVSQALCVAPPAVDQTAAQSNSGDVGSVTTIQSPDNTYYANKQFYVAEVTNVKNPFASVREAVAYSVNAASSKTICEHTTTTATLYGFDDLQGCWVQIGSTKSKLGVYSPGGGFIPASCSDAVSWTIPSTVSKVRIKGQSVLQTAFGPAGQSIAEGTQWFH